MLQALLQETCDCLQNLNRNTMQLFMSVFSVEAPEGPIVQFVTLHTGISAHFCTSLETLLTIED